MNKKWFKSKVLWINALAIVGIVLTGKEFSTETVGIVLSILNMILRLITKEGLEL